MPLVNGFCEECGFGDWPDSPNLSRRHGEHHRMWRDGVRIPPCASDRIVARAGDIDVLLVDASSHPAQRSRAEAVVRRANLYELRYHFPQYEAAEAFGAQRAHIWLARRAGRGVGFVVAVWDESPWYLTWDQYDRCDAGMPMVPAPHRWCIDLVWVHRGHRRQGIARLLIGAATEHLGVPAADLGWRTSLRPDGKALAQALSPQSVWLL